MTNNDINKIDVITNPSKQFLEDKNVKSWGIWEKEISEFDWFYDEREMCFILEGEVTVILQDGESVTIKKGDFVTFPKGMKCFWKVTKDIRKHFLFG